VLAKPAGARDCFGDRQSQRFLPSNAAPADGKSNVHAQHCCMSRFRLRGSQKYTLMLVASELLVARHLFTSIPSDL
jgi:hypothetical protein